MTKEDTNEILIKLDGIIRQAKGLISSNMSLDLINNKMITLVEGFFYSTILNNFKANLTEENLKAFNITKDDVSSIVKTFKEIFKASEKTIKNNPDLGEIDSKVYQKFKEELERIGKNAYNLLLEIEKYVNYSKCQKKVNEFEEEILKLGKKLNVKHKMEDGNYVTQIGLEED